MVLFVCSESSSHVVTSQFVLLFRVIEYIFSEVDKHIEAGDLISEFKMSALPSLYELFVKLIKYLVGFQSLFLLSSFLCHFYGYLYPSNFSC